MLTSSKTEQHKPYPDELLIMKKGFMKESGQLHFRDVELPVCQIDDNVDTDIPADLIAVRRHVVSLEHERTTLAQTVQYAHRNLQTESYSQDNGQRMLLAAVLDLDRLDRSLSRARLAQAKLENHAAAQRVRKLHIPSTSANAFLIPPVG